jgi:hypothetical protein
MGWGGTARARVRRSGKSGRDLRRSVREGRSVRPVKGGANAAAARDKEPIKDKPIEGQSKGQSRADQRPIKADKEGDRICQHAVGE